MQGEAHGWERAAVLPSARAWKLPAASPETSGFRVESRVQGAVGRSGRKVGSGREESCVQPGRGAGDRARVGAGAGGAAASLLIRSWLLCTCGKATVEAARFHVSPTPPPGGGRDKRSETPAPRRAPRDRTAAAEGAAANPGHPQLSFAWLVCAWGEGPFTPLERSLKNKNEPEGARGVPGSGVALTPRERAQARGFVRSEPSGGARWDRARRPLAAPRWREAGVRRGGACAARGRRGVWVLMQMRLPLSLRSRGPAPRPAPCRL